MQAVYFTLVAIALYLAADWLLERIEVAIGRRLENRTLLFLAILMALAVTTFAVIRHYTGNPG